MSLSATLCKRRDFQGAPEGKSCAEGRGGPGSKKKKKKLCGKIRRAAPRREDSNLLLSRNGFWAPVPRTSGNPEVRPSWRDPGVKSFPTSPQTSFYIAQATGSNITSAEFDRDFYDCKHKHHNQKTSTSDMYSTGDVQVFGLKLIIMVSCRRLSVRMLITATWWGRVGAAP